ncbi:DUF547 domain-containing protein [Marinigracilibium pacificum]|uniref:DUF547 domain-containing protein n=1 Tax=Marinigracilibium pacificum TaxID=2729599 RepID=A0A848J119_9BACT|nr:DUF547 domain-containing protein [Marinigracilibium pacificum]NMM49506.1 DUF547 domain-containing protein [Marinigracilibium pacificum]
MKTHLIVSLILIANGLFAQNKYDEFTNRADKFLNKYVEKGRVDYASIKDNPREINDMYAMLADIDLQGKDKNELTAFYINAYNIIVIHQIVKYYPLKSAINKNGFFNMIKHDVAGEQLTLDKIEKGKVIFKYGDPRVHFAFSCAANSCPELANFAFKPEVLDKQLDTRTKKAVDDSNFIKVNTSSKKVELNQIFEWYNKDFTQKGQDVITWINQYKTNDIPNSFKVTYYSYDWGLNIRY